LHTPPVQDIPLGTFGDTIRTVIAEADKISIYWLGEEENRVTDREEGHTSTNIRGYIMPVNLPAFPPTTLLSTHRPTSFEPNTQPINQSIDFIFSTCQVFVLDFSFPRRVLTMAAIAPFHSVTSLNGPAEGTNAFRPLPPLAV